MGSYTTLYLGPFYLGGEKNSIDPLVMVLFRESDKDVYEVDADSPDAGEYADPDYYEMGNTITRIVYACDATVLRDRLELMGFTLAAAKQAFQIAVQREVLRLQRMMEFGTEFLNSLLEQELRLIETLTAEDWFSGLGEIVEQDLQSGGARHDVDDCSYSAVIHYILCAVHSSSDQYYGYPGDDVRHMMRLLLEACREDDELIYDVTDVMEGGYFEGAEDLTQYADNTITANFAETRRVIVLTEGSTDKWVVERSLRLLYPHLADYFSFMDFEGAKVPGGAGALAGMVKAFVGAGVLNRIVALFDNDTAARAAMKSLDQVKLPANVVVLRHPDLPLARDYPTVGPAGIARMDVNGLAGSIELYLGVDVLRLDDGTLAPVQWRGLIDGLREYQGEILDKARIHERFKEKLRVCEESPARVDEFDWSGMLLICDTLRTAFHPADAEALLNAGDLNDGG